MCLGPHFWNPRASHGVGLSLCPEDPPISASCLPALCLLLLCVPCVCPLGSVWQPLLASARQSAAVFPRQLGSLSWPPQGRMLLVSGVKKTKRFHPTHSSSHFRTGMCAILRKSVCGGCTGSRRACRQLLRPIASRLPDTQMGEMITCGSMGNTCVSAACILFQSNNEQWDSFGTEKCEFAGRLIMVSLLKPKSSVILLENQLKVKRVCSTEGQKGHFKQVPLNQGLVQIQVQKNRNEN